MLGLCPLLAVSQTSAQSLTCGVLFASIVLGCGVVASGLRHFVSWRLRPLYHALLAASVTACVVALAQLVAYDAVAALGIYPALIAGNCYVLSHIQETAERQPLRAAVLGGSRDVGAIVGFLVVLGAAREWLAYGRVFGAAGAELDGVLPIFATAPGALLLLSLAAAASNRLFSQHADRTGTVGRFRADAGGPITPVATTGG
jgi:electron transport complex protein RnfE